MFRKHFDQCGGHLRRGMVNPKWGFDPREFWSQGPWGRRGGWGGRGRVFDQGNLKYVVLQLLAEKPRHGYEIIKAIEEQFGGTYAPSPGTVYPTLSMLEDMGFARVIPEASGRKIYEITDAGRAHLDENRGAVDDIFAKISDYAQNIFGEPMMQIHRAFKDVGRAVYVGDRRRTPQQLQQVADILARAAKEIDEVSGTTP